MVGCYRSGPSPTRWRWGKIGAWVARLLPHLCWKRKRDMQEGSENGERRKGKERGRGISKKNVGRGNKRET
jgi:hypothetical protein